MKDLGEKDLIDGVNTMFRKNDILEIEITDQGTTGEGIGKIEGYTLFVKDTVIGDVAEVKIMKAKKNYAFARLVKIVKPSKYRVAPLCSVARSCGGCQLQAMSYEQQLRFKQEKVFNNIKRIGGIDDFVMKPIMGMEELAIPGHEENGPFHYRNKAQFPVGINKDGKIVSGFYAGRTHSIIEVDSCMLGTLVKLEEDSECFEMKKTPAMLDINKTVMDIVKRYMNREGVMPYDEVRHEGLVRHVLIRVGKHTSQVMVCVIINGNKLPKADALVEQLLEVPGITDISININKEKNNVILGEKIINLYGPGYVEDYIGDVKFRISPLSFFQVNPTQTEKLYKKALEYAGLTGSETVWDLYCGIGSISLFLAKKARKVIGVEIVQPAVEDARINAKINGIENAEFIVGAAEEVVPKYFAKHQGEQECRPDVIVVDPPRKGCDEMLLKTMVEMAPNRIVYVSCDSATLARDLKWLKENGYKLKEVTPCDMFGQGVHVETVVLLSQQKPDDRIEVEIELDELEHFRMI
jgi:23S rRNA (uracil1939-C5)-methyltransferase